MTGALRSIDQLRFGSLKVRIAALYALLFAAVLAIVMITVGQGIERFGERSASRDLTANARVFDEILELRASQMRGAADVLSRDFGFREAVATRDEGTIVSALDSLRNRSRSSAAFVVGLDGSVVGTPGAKLPAVETIWGPLDEGRERGVIRLEGRLALAAASPIEAPNTIGWLVLAEPLDKQEMARLAELAAVKLDARVLPAGSLPGYLATAPLGEVIERDEGEAQLYRLSRLPALEEGVEPRLVLRHSLGEALAEYATLNWLLAALSALGLVLTVALSWRVARTITKPLRDLDEATRLIGEGREVELKADTDDEVGRLAHSFNAMVAALEERERRIVHVGLHDDLTNLPNRKLFIEQLGQALARRKDGDRIMVVYVDLDDFKLINDTLGHPAGDTLLREVASGLATRLENATVARLGGDEFAVLLTEIADSANPAALAERIQGCFGRAFELEGQQIQCTASLGVAVAPVDGDDGTTLMKHADLALYRAKREGKAGYHFFEPSLDEQARVRRQMELDLRVAIREGGFELYFQPLYSLSDDTLNGFEALIRWPHPTQGLIGPAEFIPLAEETGLIVPIGEWVVREACRRAAKWPEDLSVAVNISAKQFAAGDLSTSILQALTASGIAPQRLELEITESIFIANVEKTLSTLHGLRDLGVRIALDDFGTGYSSLSYLRSFPFDKLKIDRSFVQDLAKESNAHAVIRAITSLAEALGMETLAEGVEEQEQLDILRREGCRYIQGFLLSKPMAARDADELVRAWSERGEGLRVA